MKQVDFQLQHDQLAGSKARIAEKKVWTSKYCLAVLLLQNLTNNV